MNNTKILQYLHELKSHKIFKLYKKREKIHEKNNELKERIGGFLRPLIGLSFINMFAAYIVNLVSFLQNIGGKPLTPEQNSVLFIYSVVTICTSLIAAYCAAHEEEIKNSKNQSLDENTKEIAALLETNEVQKFLLNYLNSLGLDFCENFSAEYSQEEIIELKHQLLVKDYATAVSSLEYILSKTPQKLEEMEKEKKLKDYEERLNPLEYEIGKL